MTVVSDMRLAGGVRTGQAGTKLGIRFKLFLLSVGLIALALIASEAYLTRMLEAQLVERIRTDLLVRAKLIAQRVGAVPAPLENSDLYDAIADDAAHAAAVRVTLVRADGTVAGDSHVDVARLPDLENHARRAEIVDAFARGEGSSVRLSATVHQRLMYVAVPLVRRGEAIGAVRVAMPLTGIDRAIADLRRTLAAAGVFAMAVAALVSWLAAQLTSHKARELTNAARRMADGDLTVRTRTSGRDEIAALGAALDQLAAALERSLGELRDERDLLAGILSSMAEGVLVVDRDGRIVLMNAALRSMLMLGVDPAGRYILHVVRNAQLDALLEATARGDDSETELDLAGLRPRRVLVRAVPLRSAPSGVLAVFVDVTELRRLESVRRDFVANVSHELRSPLTTIRAAAETLHSVTADPLSAARFAELIERNAERLERLVNDMLDLSRIESHETELALETLDLSNLVDRVVKQHAARAELKRIALAAHIPSGTGVRGERRALEQVLANLVDNALKYSPDGASVRVTASRTTDDVRISVIDTGPGIAPEHLPRLFERFYRVDPGRSRELGGTGLGLAIVKHLVEAMNGSVSVESSPGAGSTFSFTLHAA